MSSRGLYFNVQEPLQVGQALELLLDWPAKRANKERVRLVVLGRVVRIEKAGAAMTIQKYWFETSRLSGHLAGVYSKAGKDTGK